MHCMGDYEETLAYREANREGGVVWGKGDQELGPHYSTLYALDGGTFHTTFSWAPTKAISGPAII